MTDTLNQTPLHSLNVELGAKMVDFAGWSMPVQYSGIIEEHTQCREKAALFDVSHMGQVELGGVMQPRLWKNSCRATLMV